MSAKRAINDKLQGSVATYLRHGRVFNNQIKKGLLLSLWVKIVLKSVNIWQSYKLCHCASLWFDRIIVTSLWPRLFGPPCSYTLTYTHTRLMALCPGLPGWAGTRKVKPIWILLKQETVSGSGISWAMCKSAPCSRQITMPPPHHSASS